MCDAGQVYIKGNVIIIENAMLCNVALINTGRLKEENLNYKVLDCRKSVIPCVMGGLEVL